MSKITPEKVALVTGGTTGIGRAIVQAFAKEGMRVYTFGRHQETLKQSIAEAERMAPGRVTGSIADVGKQEDMQKLFDTISKEAGRLDVLVNNAGLSGDSVSDSDSAQWRYVVETNLIGTMLCSQLAASAMHEGGHIVNIGSTSAEDMEAGGDVYVATKAGIKAFSSSLQKTLGSRGIRVTLIEPGVVGTDMTLDEGGVDAQSKSESENKMLCAEDIAEAVLFALRQPRANISELKVEPLLVESS
jgi:NADP-dependent 3-hydroxy acid dehydrogenase YdfG